MSVRDLFNETTDRRNDARHQATRINDNVLYTCYWHGSGGSWVQQTYFDFLTRTVSIQANATNGIRIMTFGEMDPQVLRLHHDMLKELGGNPQPLPDELQKPAPAKTAGLSL